MADVGSHEESKARQAFPDWLCAISPVLDMRAAVFRTPAISGGCESMLSPFASFDAGFLHPMLGFDHQLAMIAVGIWSGQIGGRMIWAAPLGFMAMMAVGGMLGMAGVPFPFVERGIVASIILFGCLIACAFDPKPWAGATAVGAFALFHGHAHGVEMQAGNLGFWYAAGFVLATGLLHLTGIALYKSLEWKRLQGQVRWVGVAISLAGIGLVFV